MPESNEIFLEPVLQGKRFVDHAIPVEILQDLAILENLIFEIAREVYLRDNAGRQRCPEGFTDNVNLKLSEIGEGSAVPKLTLTYANTGNLLFEEHPYLNYFEKAKDVLVEFIANSGQIKNLSIDSERIKKYFVTLGRHLKEGESMIFKARNQKIAQLTTSVRKEILLSGGEREYEKAGEFIARVSVFDKHQGSFEALVEGSRLGLPPTDDYYNILLDAFNNYEENALVLINATAIYNHIDKLQRIKDLESVITLDPMDINYRLYQLSELKQGWFDGVQGEIISMENTSRFRELFNLYFESELPLPAIFPTINGNLSLEWSTDRSNLILEIYLLDLTSELLVVDKISNYTSEESILDLNEKNDWLALNKIIGKEVSEDSND